MLVTSIFSFSHHVFCPLKAIFTVLATFKVWFWIVFVWAVLYLLGGKGFNHLLNNKILDMTKLKAFADDKLNIAKMMISLFDRAENTALC